MPLTICRECKREVSTEAKTCPYCGRPDPTKPLKAERSYGGCALAIVVVIFVGMIADHCSSDSPSPEETANREHANRVAFVRGGAEDAVKKLLKDPESARFSRISIVSHGDKMAECGYVNAKNGFGGYTGDERFISGGETAYLPSMIGEAGFDQLWNQLCVGGKVE